MTLWPAPDLFFPAQSTFMQRIIRIGTRDSRLALWQAETVRDLLQTHGYDTELVPVKSEGDLDLVTPLYAMGVQGVFTKTLDAALLSNRIDIAVHSMKDVPVQLAQGIVQAAVLPRASWHDILVPRIPGMQDTEQYKVIATGSVRRRAQWLHRYPGTDVENLRGNVQTRLRKLRESNWDAAVFAAAGLERIQLRPEYAITMDWMLPAPAQGAVMVVCRQGEDGLLEACAHFDDPLTALCVREEREFLRTLMGGCSAPVSALAEVRESALVFKGNVLSVNGKDKMEAERAVPLQEAKGTGAMAAQELLDNGAGALIASIRNLDTNL
jgi:hydroxymethylbilane synthase